ncbi:MAG: GH1 family beta-glucosidase [Verrucomicrobia bacterium]|jgi:beta-glucosidase|nr:GH1 family beta-glucosidase [Verrucomicrobiota bacterium]
MNMETQFPLNRRDFMARTAAVTAALAAGSALPARGKPVAETSRAPEALAFPKGFWWGTATAAYQIEGGANADGRKPSIWDTFSRQAGATKDGLTGDVACDHYHRFEDDVKLMADLGVKHYRFSISWSRLIPDGRGALNPKGVDFYRRLAEALRAHGITPHATLYHWDLPQALQDRYAGWQSREVTKDYADYAAAAARSLGDVITHWITMNEISCFAFWNGYNLGKPGHHAPGIELKTRKERAQTVHHALVAHGLGCQALRASSPGRCHVATAENFTSFVPIVETEEHLAAARRAFVAEEPNACILLPLLTGAYNQSWLEGQGDQAPEVVEGDLETIGQPLDALGFNCYSGIYVRAADNRRGYELIPMFDNFPKGNMPWLNIVPESIYWGVRMVGEAAGQARLPVFISENGCADGAAANARHEVADVDRIMYLRAYLRSVQRLVAEGHPMVGYFPWSLMDNFEWAEGYTKRFGLVRVDYATQERIPKLSYHWYRHVIQANRVV